MRVLVLQHIACEHPGVFSEVMRERGVEAVAVELDRGEPLPDWREFDAVLAMGGPMGAGDDDDHPWLAAEKRLVAEAVGAGLPFLGVCLGVQLLAAALGARVYEAERAEVGLLEVELTAEGRDDPLFAGFDEQLPLAPVARRHLRASRRGRCAWRARRSPRTRRFAPASAPTACSSTSRSRARWRASGGRSPPTAGRWPRPSARSAGRRSSPTSSAVEASSTRARGGCSRTGSTSARTAR